MTNESLSPSPVTTLALRRAKRDGERIAVLTAYDASMSALLDAAGVDVILVGDSLGMVIQGRQTTVPVSVDDMVYHTACVARAARRSLVMADMPFLSYRSPEQALDTAALLMQQGGAGMVKLEGGAEQVPVVEALASRGVPVCAHLGLQPQYVHKLGGYRLQGKGAEAATQMLDAARVLASAGADMLVLECVPAALAGRIRAALDIPVIGIGAGRDCDGQVLVLYDVLGISVGRIPRFSKDFTQGEASLRSAIDAYVLAVKSGAFPDEAHILG